jgi:hypothetical protein
MSERRGEIRHEKNGSEDGAALARNPAVDKSRKYKHNMKTPAIVEYLPTS